MEFAHRWCIACGSDLGHYHEHLAAGHASDRLEVLLASIAMNTMINIVFEDTVWSTTRDGPDFHFLTIIWTTAGAVACHSMDPDTGVMADIDTSKTSESVSEEKPVPAALQERKFSG